MADPVEDFVKSVSEKLKPPKMDFGSIVIGAALACIAVILYGMTKRQPPGRVVALPTASLPAGRPGAGAGAAPAAQTPVGTH